MPRALHFSTPRSRRHSSGAEADVDALCAELDARVRSLQLARAQGSSQASSAALAAEAGTGPRDTGPARDPFSPEAAYRHASGTPQGAPFSTAPTSDWAGTRRQLAHPPPPLRHKSHRGRHKSRRPVTGGPTVLCGQGLTLALTLNPNQLPLPLPPDSSPRPTHSPPLPPYLRPGQPSLLLGYTTKEPPVAMGPQQPRVQGFLAQPLSFPRPGSTYQGARPFKASEAHQECTPRVNHFPTPSALLSATTPSPTPPAASRQLSTGLTTMERPPASWQALAHLCQATLQPWIGRWEAQQASTIPHPATLPPPLPTSARRRRTLRQLPTTQA